MPSFAQDERVKVLREEDLQEMPLLVFGNKHVPNALSPVKLAEILELHSLDYNSLLEKSRP